MPCDGRSLVTIDFYLIDISPKMFLAIVKYDGDGDVCDAVAGDGIHNSLRNGKRPAIAIAIGWVWAPNDQMRRINGTPVILPMFQTASDFEVN